MPVFIPFNPEKCFALLQFYSEADKVSVAAQSYEWPLVRLQHTAHPFQAHIAWIEFPRSCAADTLPAALDCKRTTAPSVTELAKTCFLLFVLQAPEVTLQSSYSFPPPPSPTLGSHPDFDRRNSGRSWYKSKYYAYLGLGFTGCLLSSICASLEHLSCIAC